MSHQLISRSPDLKRLQNEGYDLEIRSGFLLTKGIPYVNARREVCRGTLVVKLVLAGDVTTRPDDHVAYFAGEHPCRADGTRSEEHTTELQSPCNLVCRLLLEKKESCDQNCSFHHFSTFVFPCESASCSC